MVWSEYLLGTKNTWIFLQFLLPAFSLWTQLIKLKSDMSLSCWILTKATSSFPISFQPYLPIQFPGELTIFVLIWAVCWLTAVAINRRTELLIEQLNFRDAQQVHDWPLELKHLCCNNEFHLFSLFACCDSSAAVLCNEKWALSRTTTNMLLEGSVEDRHCLNSCWEAGKAPPMSETAVVTLHFLERQI